MEKSNPPNNTQIIIIDDDQLVRNFTVHTLEYGINRKILTFESGFDGWQHIQGQPENVDLVIADANIPDLDGMELLSRVKKNFPKKKFILITSDSTLEGEAKRLGADVFMGKPYDIKDLFQIVQKFCSGLTPPAHLKITPLPRPENSTSADSE